MELLSMKAPTEVSTILEPEKEVISFKTKAMFGLVVNDGMEWNGVVINYVPLFGYTKNEWSGMEYNGTHSITYHPIF
jgi:hypothetical protein